MCAYTKFIIHFCLINNLMIFKKIHLYICLNISINVHVKKIYITKVLFLGRRSVVIKEVKKPNFKKWRPILVFINPKSGNNEGYKLLRAFRGILNPAQVT